MRVYQLMTVEVRTCHETDSLAEVARIMWDHDVGAVPILDVEGKLRGIATDRDLCMAALFSGEALWAMPVGEHLRKSTQTVEPGDTLEQALQIMRKYRVRRLPVIDEDRRPVGMVALADLVSAAHCGLSGAPDPVALIASIAEISEARAARAPRHVHMATAAV